jgi:hypothetical protein
MSSGDSWGFAPPPFKPEEALQRLRREWRELGLAEREGVFERRGLAIARARIDGAVLAVDVVRRPARLGPEWQSRVLRSGADVRDCTADLKKKLAQWSDRDE